MSSIKLKKKAFAAHNIACARARNGDHAGESELRGLLGKYRAYDATILYNLAHMMRLRGDCQNARRCKGVRNCQPYVTLGSAGTRRGSSLW